MCHDGESIQVGGRDGLQLDGTDDVISGSVLDI